MTDPQSRGSRDDRPRPHSDTLYKIEKLRELRENSKRDGKVTVSWIIACQMVGIDPKTVRRHCPELRMRWSDWEY